MLDDLISAEVGPVDVADAELHHSVHPHLQRLAWPHEDAFPVYRVTSWVAPRKPPELADAPQPMAFNAERYRLTGAIDVHEALAWANADGRRFELFVEVTPGLPPPGQHGPEVLRLCGFNPAKVGQAHPADYLSDATEADSVVEWVRAQGYTL